MKKLMLGMILLFAINFISADSQTLTMKFIVPGDTYLTFDNLRNFTHPLNTPFSQSITASSSVEIECYWLNDTSKFDVDCSGLITNITTLNSVEIIYLNITVNNTIGEEISGDFYVNIVPYGIGNVCRYRKFGYYNQNIPFLRELNCVETDLEGFTIR